MSLARRKVESRQRVTVMWDPVPAVLLRKGEQVSEVEFADGRVRNIPNEHILPLLIRIRKQKVKK